MSSPGISITGVPTARGADGSVPVRREIRELRANSPEQYNLFMLGLRMMQQMPPQNLTSYYQIAGIHGMPYKPWDGVAGRAGWEGGFGGYCTHSSILFATWHRPFLALLEQSLYSAIQGIAQGYPPDIRAKYVDEAKKFRLPYFDWSARVQQGAPYWPAEISSSRIRVQDVDGKMKTMDNPLYSYSFAGIPAGDIHPYYLQFPRTTRHPDSSGRSNDAAVETSLRNSFASRSRATGVLLLSYPQFDGFTSDAWQTQAENPLFDSLEGLHNQIHGIVGGPNPTRDGRLPAGSMSGFDTSAYDPVFWLHHSNVDRLWAIWQDLHPNSFMTSRQSENDTFWAASGTRQDQNTSLPPFRYDDTATGKKAFWTSLRAKDTTVFGYAYPETRRWAYPNTQAYQNALRTTITQLYGGNVFQNFAANIAPVSPNSADEKPLVAPKVALRLKNAPKAGVAMGLATVGDEGKGRGAHMAASTGVLEGDDINSGSDEEGVLNVTHPHENPVIKDDISTPSGPVPESLKHLAPEGKYLEWIVNVRAVKHGLGQTFSVFVFDCEVSDDPLSWGSDYNTVGRVVFMGREQSTDCEACQDQRERQLVTTGTVVLTSALLQDIQAGRLASLKQEDVVPYLKENLGWGCRMLNGTRKEPNEVPGLKISVCAVDVTLDADGVPSYGASRTFKEITDGKEGGLGAGEDENA